MKLLIAAAACAALGITCYVLGRDERNAPAAVTTRDDPLSIDQAATLVEGHARERSPATVVPLAMPSARMSSRFRVQGRVIDVDGKPVTGGRIETALFELRLDGTTDAPSAPVSADSAGRFELDVAGPCSLRWIGDDDRLRTIVEALVQWREAAELEYEIVVATHTRVHGCVEDEVGRPLHWMNVRWRAADSWIAGIAKGDPARQRWHGPNVSSMAEFEGCFDLDVPSIEGSRLELCDDDVVIETRSLLNQDELDVRFVVRNEIVEGTLVRPDGSPVVGAEIDSGDSVTSDVHGRFVFPASRLSTEDRWLRICEPKWNCVKLANFGKRWNARDRSRAFVIVLDALPSVLQGSVVNADGTPAVGWRVDVSKRPEVDDLAENRFVPAVAVGAQADARGRFEIRHASPGMSELYLRSPDDLIGFYAPDIKANDPATLIRVPNDAVVPLVRGQIMSTHGEPIPNALIAFDISAFDDCVVHTGRKSATSDADGRFEIRDVSRNATRVSVSDLDERYLPYEKSALELEPGDRTTIRIALAARVRFERRRFDIDGDRIVFLDAHEKPLPCWRIADFADTPRKPRYEMPWTACALEGDLSPELAIADHAAYVAVYGTKGEVARVPVTLAAGRENVVIWP